MSLTKKQAQVSRGYRYGYYVAAPAQDGKPTVLLVHGWPDDSTMWFNLATKHLLPAGYGVLMPDMLGYGGTDKERDPRKYLGPLLIKDLTDILDNEGLDRVVVTGHDWGSSIAQRFYLYAPQRTLALGMVCVAYSPPSSKPVDIKALNDMLEQVYGMRCFEYMVFFASDESDAVAEKHVEAAFHMCYNDDFDKTARELFTQPGNFRRALEQDRLLPLHPSVTEEEKQRWIARMKRDGFNGPFNYYRAFINHGDPQLEKATLAGPAVEVPTLYVGYTDDLVCRKENILRPQAGGLLPHLTNVTLQGGHWGLIQDPEPFGRAYTAWLSAQVQKGSGRM